MQALEYITEGRTRTDACDKAGVSIPVFERTCKEVPEMADLLADAERRGYDALADALITIDNHAVHGQSDPKMAKVISDNIKWLLSKRRIKDYGDKIQIDHTITADAAIIGALTASRQRVAQLAITSGTVIDAEFSEVDEDARILAEIMR